MKNLKKSEVRRNLLSRILLFCTGIIIVLLAVSAGLGQGTENGPRLDDFDKAAIREAASIAHGTARALDVYMDARISEMLVCSMLSERFRGGLATPETRGDANRILEGWLKTSGAYDAILVLDKAGICLASAPAGLVNQDFSDNSAFQAAAKGKLSILDAHKSDAVASLDPPSKGWTATIAVPIRVENRVEGALMSFLKWSRLSDLVMSVRVGKTGYVYVLNSQNQIIIHPGKELYGMGLRDPRINLPALDAAVKNKVTGCCYDFKNVRTGMTDTKLVGFAYPQGYGHFSGLGWTVGAGADRSEMQVDQSILKLLLRSYFFR